MKQKETTIQIDTPALLHHLPAAAAAAAAGGGRTVGCVIERHACVFLQLQQELIRQSKGPAAAICIAAERGVAREKCLDANVEETPEGSPSPLGRSLLFG